MNGARDAPGNWRGFPDRIGPAAGEVPETVEITENGLRFEVDLITGQKTGFFLDQRRNREIVGALQPGGGGPELLLLHRRLFRLRRPRGGKPGRFRGGLGCG